MDDHEDDPFVPIWEGAFLDADALRLRLEEASIPVDLGDALEPGRARVQVPRSYVSEAGDVIEGVAANWPSVTTLIPDRPERRIWIALVALVLVVLLVVLAVF